MYRMSSLVNAFKKADPEHVWREGCGGLTGLPKEMLQRFFRKLPELFSKSTNLISQAPKSTTSMEIHASHDVAPQPSTIEAPTAYGFITFDSSQHRDEAVSRLHRRVVFGPESKPLKVQIATLKPGDLRGNKGNTANHT